MKKLVILTAMLMLCASTCFAAQNGSIDFSTVGKSLHGAPTGTADANSALIGKMSNNVDVAWQTGATGYALMAQHKSGTKAYGSAYSSTSIYQTVAEAQPGTAAFNSGALTASDSSDFLDTAWKPL